MVIYYIGNQTFASDQLNFDTTWSNNGNPDTAQIPTNFPVVDSSAYVSKVAPIPDGSGFLMSRLYEDPKVLALDFRDAPTMSVTLDRISAFVEINGKKKIATTTQLSGEGIDLKLKDVVDFYNQCRRQKTPITSGEQEFLTRLEETGLILKDENANYSAASPFALIGMSRSKDIYARRLIFVHEYSHAKYFVNPLFNAAVSDAWSSLAPAEQRFLKGAMMASGWYTSGDKWLFETEAQAHAIAPPLGTDAFINILIAADENCSKPNGPAEQCDDFWSYTDNIQELLVALYDKYRKMSECQIPLLENWGTTSNMITSAGIPAHCSEKKVPHGNKDKPEPAPIDRLLRQIPSTNFRMDTETIERLMQDYRLRNTFDHQPNILDAIPAPATAGRVESALMEIQEKFDTRHKKRP